MRTLVTGANGFVGRHVVTALHRVGIEVRSAVRNVVSLASDHGETVRAPDLGSGEDDWRSAVSGMDAVVHCAARVHQMNDSAEDALALYRRTNRDGTLQLARAAAQAGVRRFVFVSSIKVNGEATEPGAPFTADDAPQPLDPYGQSKAEAEDALFALGDGTGMAITVIRPVLVYGPGVAANFAALIELVARGLPLPFGAVRNARSLVYVENLADLVREALQNDSAAGQRLLVSDGRDLSTRELVVQIGAAMDRRVRLLPVPPAALRFAGTMLGKRAMMQRLTDSLQVDIAATRRRLNWTPPFTVEQGLAATVAAWRANRNAS